METNTQLLENLKKVSYMVHAKNEAPATINNAESTNFNFSFILFSFIRARGVSYRKLHRNCSQTK